MSEKTIRIRVPAEPVTVLDGVFYNDCLITTASAIALRDSIDAQLKVAALKDPQEMTEDECIEELRGKNLDGHHFFIDVTAFYFFVHTIRAGEVRYIPESRFPQDFTTILLALRAAVAFMRDKKDWSEV